MKYLFHVTDGVDAYKDEDGEEFPTPQDARAHATTIAAELGEDGSFDGFLVIVVDEDDEVVVRVPVPSFRACLQGWLLTSDGWESEPSSYSRNLVH